MITIHKDNHHIAIMTMDMPNKSTNLLGELLMLSLEQSVSELESDPEIKGVILTSAKKDFIAGADLDMLFDAADVNELMETGLKFKSTLRRLETLGKPVVAAINGTALGGGFEIALACHYRIAINHPKLRIGFPECKLGLFPGGGGTQRLPRMIGVQNALPILLEALDFPAAIAAEKGLVDQLADDPDHLMKLAHNWIEANPEGAQPWDRKDFRWPGGNPKGPAMAQLWSVAATMLHQKTRGNYPNQNDALAAVYEGSQVDFETADRIETRYFAHTTSSQTAKNMITAFWYNLNAIKKGQSRPNDTPPSKINKVGILGAGMMGAGIAYVSAYAGVDVVLKDVTLELAEKGKGYSQKLLEKRIKRGKMNQERAEHILGRIHTTQDAADLNGCDLIIEAVFEDRELKAKVTAEAEAQIGDDAVFASNTSTLPISGLAERSARPGNFIGLHFFSPVDKMPLVEIIVGKETSSQTLARAFDFVLQIRKMPVVVNDSRGFYTSRVFSTYVQEGMALLQEGQNPRAIESAGLQAGMPVGPLALSDEVSLSLMHHIQTQTRKDLEAEGKTYPEHPSHQLVNRMVNELKRPGKKAGAGFYEYPTDVKKHLWTGLTEQFPQAEVQLDQQEMMERMLFIQAIETVRCFEEGVLTSTADANIGSIFGWGFAPFHGGTLQYINAYGLTRFVERAKELAERHGSRFTPPKMLLEKAERGEGF